MEGKQEASVPTTPNFQVVFESLPGACLLLDVTVPEFRIVAVSDAYLAATMTQRERIVGRGLFEVFPDNPGDPSGGTGNLRASLERVIATGRADTMAIQKYDIRRPEVEGGAFEERHWSPTNGPVRSPDGVVRHVIHHVEDVTEFVRLKRQGIDYLRESKDTRPRAHQDEKLLQSQRMEAMGQLAGGVAHDFNNILTAILLNCDHILSERDVPAAIVAAIGEVRDAGERAAALTRQLLAFTRKQVMQRRILNLNTVVANMRDMLERVLADNITLSLATAADLGNTAIDATQVDQIVLNLVVNAQDAMPDGGRISIETANATLDERAAAGSPRAEPGQFVVLTVRDTGMGMTAATKARLFEPFFTTKGVGRGTGLGLATVYGIVEQNKGTIWVHSEPRRGTTFNVYLPRAGDEVTAAPARRDSAPDVRGTGSVLVVEDQDSLRRLIGLTLTSHGYTVHSAANGREALSLFDSLPAVDLVVTDVIMPDMGGRALAACIAARWPVVKVLFLSGYAGDMVGMADGELHFLEKPFAVADLLAKVGEVLGR